MSANAPCPVESSRLKAIETRPASRASASTLRHPPAMGVRANVLWSAVGTAGLSVQQYAFLAVLAKLGTPALLGEFALALAIVTPAIAISQMQLRQLLITDATRQVPFGAYLRLRSIAAAVAAGIVIVATFVVHDGGLAAAVAVVMCSKSTESLSDVCWGSLQRGGRMDMVAASIWLRSLLGVATFAFALLATGDLPGAMTGPFVVGMLLFVLLDAPLGRRLASTTGATNGRTAPQMANLLRLGLPLAGSVVLVALATGLPRWFLAWYEGPEAVGTFTTASTTLTILALLSATITQGTLPRMAELWAVGDSRRFVLANVAVTGALVASGLGLVGVLDRWGGTIVPILFAPEYLDAIPTGIILAAGASISALGMAASQILTIERRVGALATCTAALLVVQGFACWLLIPRWGVEGAAWAEFTRYTSSVLVMGLTAWWVVMHPRPKTAEMRDVMDESPMLSKAVHRLGIAKRSAHDWYHRMTWIAGGRRGAPPHGVKRRLLRTIARRLGLEVLVETGTFQGDMVRAMHRRFRLIHSIELSADLHRSALGQFAHLPHVRLHVGDSAAVLPELVRTLDAPALFWLDAHYSGGFTARGERDTPIEDELRTIFTDTRVDHAILIDDARCFTGRDGYPTIDALRNLVYRLRPHYAFEVRDDVIRVLPARDTPARPATREGATANACG